MIFSAKDKKSSQIIFTLGLLWVYSGFTLDFTLDFSPSFLFHSPVSCSKLLQTCFNVNLAYSKRVSKFTSKIELFCTNFMISRKISEKYQKGIRKVSERCQKLSSTPLKILQFCSIFQNSFSIVFFRAFKIILII